MFKSESALSYCENIDLPTLYSREVVERPIYYCNEQKVWIANSYAYCKYLFSSADALIPAPVIPECTGNVDKVRQMIAQLARLNNGYHHELARNAAMLIYQQVAQTDTKEIVKKLLSIVTDLNNFDWVATVCKKLPVLLILTGLGFSTGDSDWIVTHMPELVKIMSPQRTSGDMYAAEIILEKLFKMISINLQKKRLINSDLLVCNLIGLLIQSYDAGRGLLSNLITHLHELGTVNLPDPTAIKKFVTEILRFDPPVHHTRRIAVRDIAVANQTIKGGEQILLVMAAANRDPDVFRDPTRFDMGRNNNDANLSFGTGGHACIAKYLATDMVEATCAYLLATYEQVNILPQYLSYEPQLNAKLPIKLLISLNKKTI